MKAMVEPQLPSREESGPVQSLWTVSSEGAVPLRWVARSPVRSRLSDQGALPDVGKGVTTAAGEGAAEGLGEAADPAAEGDAQAARATRPQTAMPGKRLGQRGIRGPS